MAPHVLEFENKVKAYQAERKCSKAEAVKAVAKADPELHKLYIREFNEQK
ncbi:MAG TPA: hypothetical protein PLZ78_15785 [Spirochaetota bacterium]|nr:hypothetical protein [Spirochaetota bacterium]